MKRKSLEEWKSKKYGRLIIIDESEPYLTPSGKKCRRFLCQCDCGKTVIVHSSSLSGGNTNSCGCLFIDSVTKHGLNSHPLYSIWQQMRQRCYNKKNPNFKNYGARGIKVCHSWRQDPRAFIEWGIKNGWDKGLQIDRKNNDGDYMPSNCRFATIKENSRNTRRIKLSMKDAEEIRMIKQQNPNMLQREIAKQFNVSTNAVWCVLNRTRWT